MLPIVTLSLAILLSVVAGLAGAYALTRGRDVIRGIFFGTGRVEDWPRGVQEDDPPPTWKFPPR